MNWKSLRTDIGNMISKLPDHVCVNSVTSFQVYIFDITLKINLNYFIFWRKNGQTTCYIPIAISCQFQFSWLLSHPSLLTGEEDTSLIIHIPPV